LADNAYITQCHAQGLYPVAYVPHNHHFLAAAASFIGDKDKALSSSLHIRKHQDTKLMREPGYATLQHYWSMPYFAWVRFGQREALLTGPAPAQDLIYPNGIWNYACGLAQIRSGDLDGASASLARLTEIANDPEMAATRLWEINTMEQILSIAREVLSGELALARGERDPALQHLEAEVALEDALTYVEPSDWYTPERHNLGAALLSMGQAEQAEDVFRKDLEIYPAKGWSLAGLEQSLRAQGRATEAERARRQHREIWASAGPRITSSRL
jgi:tetratricopeptide (TPR) repeat protein